MILLLKTDKYLIFKYVIRIFLQTQTGFAKKLDYTFVAKQGLLRQSARQESTVRDHG